MPPDMLLEWEGDHQPTFSHTSSSFLHKNCECVCVSMSLITLQIQPNTVCLTGRQNKKERKKEKKSVGSEKHFNSCVRVCARVHVRLFVCLTSHLCPPFPTSCYIFNIPPSLHIDPSLYKDTHTHTHTHK